MSAKTAIEWTDATWNPVRGCTRVSPGCGGPGKQGGCYAETVAARFSDPGSPYHGFAERGRAGSKWTGKVALIEDMLAVPLHWKKPRRIFVNSMSDLFHEALPDAAIDRVFAVMALCPQHTFQVLTKRPVRMWDYCSGLRVGAWRKAIRAIARDREPSLITDPLPNVWLGVSAERQQEADERIPLLLQTPAAVRFVSLEPLLGPINIHRLRGPDDPTISPRNSGSAYLYDIGAKTLLEGLDWVIVGGESGPNARPMHPDWARSLRDQCAAAGVPFFFKQWGVWAPTTLTDAVRRGKRSRAIDIDGNVPSGDLATDDGCAAIVNAAASGAYAFMAAVGKKAAGRLLDGIEHNGFPEFAP